MGLNETDVFMELKPASEWRFASKAALIDDIRQVLLEYPGINFGFTQPIQMRISEMLTGSSGDLSIKIFGSDITQLARLADEIAGITRGIPGSVDVQTATIDGGRFLSVDVRSEVARRFGMSTAEFAEYPQDPARGARASEIIEGKKRTPIVFATDPASPQALTTVNALEQKVMVMPDGSQAPLYELAQVSFRRAPSWLNGNAATVSPWSPAMWWAGISWDMSMN